MPQVANTSRGPGGASAQSGVAPVGNCKTTHVPRSQPAPNTFISKAQENRCTRGGAPQVLALREGETLPEGYSYVVRTPAPAKNTKPPTDTVDMSTPPDVEAHMAGEDACGRSKAEGRWKKERDKK